jgi:hypothetical protein
MKALRRKILIGTMIYSAIFLIAARALQEFGSLEEVLVWVAVGGGAMVLFGYVEAYLLENWPFWHSLPGWVKKLFPLAFAGVLGFAASAALEFGLPGAVSPTLEAIILMAINWLFSQRAYAGIKEGGYAASSR